jgi:hypothetical protein
MRSFCQNIVSIALLLPSAALADECARWDLSGRFEIEQSNGFTVGFDLAQTGDSLRGSAGYGSTSGNVAGHFSSLDEFEMTVRWSDGGIGVYTGSITPSFSNGIIQAGNIEGITVDQIHRGSRAHWSDRVPGNPGFGVARCVR